MSRQTFGELQTTTYDYISQASGSVASSTIANFIKEHLNKRMRLAQAKLKGYISHDLPQTTTSVADQQRYHYPVNTYPPIVSATMEIGDVDYPLQVISSQREWDSLNQVDFSGTTIPQYIFPMRDYFELWPIPAAAGDTITLLSGFLGREMTADDYTTGTVTLANNDATVTGAGTVFTSTMVGRWFKGTNDGYWYRIASFADALNMELESSFDGTSGAGLAYTIGETPELPPELHDILPHGAAADFYSGPRKDFQAAQAHNNYFWTGDFGNPSRRLMDAAGGLLYAVKLYSRRSESKVIKKPSRRWNRFDERFSGTLSSTI